MTTTQYLTCSELRTHFEDKKLVVLTGHGSRGQFKDFAEVQNRADEEVQRLIDIYGKFTFITGGDPNDPENPDIGALAKHIETKHGIEVFPIQAQKIQEWGGFDGLGWAGLPRAHLYETDLHGD